MVRTPTLAEFFGKMKYHNYDVYSSASKPFNLNIVGWRNRVGEADDFSDWISVYYVLPNQKWEARYFRATTRAGKPYLRNPLDPAGTAFLVRGQYKSAYALGNYRGYTALKQVKPVIVERDNDKDDKFWLQKKRYEGLFGIHLHRAGIFSMIVGVSSAGCQVFQNRKDFTEFINLCKESERRWGNSFTYTLLEF